MHQASNVAVTCLQELCQKIIKGVYNTPAHISGEAKDLLARMLTVVPDHRITFEQVGRFPGAMQISYTFTTSMVLHWLLAYFHFEWLYWLQ